MTASFYRLASRLWRPMNEPAEESSRKDAKLVLSEAEGTQSYQSDSGRSVLVTGALLLLLLAAFGLRLFRLDAQSIWWDEGISLHLATAGMAEIIANRVVNIHPPLYFVALKGWAALAGATVFSGRYLSVLASLLQVAAVYALCRRWFNPTTAGVAAVLVALAPLSVIYGQEIRV